MAFGHGKDARFHAHGFNLSDFLRSIALPRSADVAETSTLGKASKTYIAGLKDGSFSGEGLFDGAAAGGDVKLEAHLGVEDRVWSYWPQGDAVTKPGYGMLAQETSYEVTVDLGDAVGFAFEGQGDGDIERLISLLSGATSISGSGNQTIVDNGAQTTAGGAGYLHVLSKSGGTTADITLRHSTDNFGGDDTLLATFSQVSAAAVAQRVAIVGTIKRYVRAAVTLGGGGTWQFGIGIYRA